MLIQLFRYVNNNFAERGLECQAATSVAFIANLHATSPHQTIQVYGQ